MPPEPRVVTAMREFKQGLLMREASQMQAMAGRWLGVENALEAQINALARELAEEHAAGFYVSRAKVYQMERYQRLLAQTEREFGRYAEYADGMITRGQGLMARLGLEHSVRATQLSYWPSTGAYFDRLPVEAVQHMVGIAGNGAPVGELLKLRMIRDESGLPLPGVWDRLTGTLIDGTALGWNPQKTALAMRDGLAGGLQKALTIARSEQMRVYRQAGLDQYKASRVVLGQKRLTAHDGRVCAACIADEGTLYALDEIISDHPNGRCTQVPVVKDMPAVEWLSGEDWFRTQDSDLQRDVLGPGRYEAWRDGLFEFNQLTVHQRDPVWGGSVRPASLSELVH